MDRVRGGKEGKRERKRKTEKKKEREKEKPGEVFTDSYKWRDQELVRFQGSD